MCTALAGEKAIYSQTYYFIGGGFIVDEEHFGLPNNSPVNVPYPYKSATDLQRHCQETGLSLSGLMMQNELALHSKRRALEQHFANVWEVMRSGIESAASPPGVLPGKLRVPRRAAALRRMLVSSDKTTTDPMAVDWINMFALAVNEENAAGGRVVTAPIAVHAVFLPYWRIATSLSVK